MKCVLVLPLPRSGSSMVAGVLHHLGFDMGPCNPPDRANPLGYFEDVRFLRLHRAWSRRYESDPLRLRLRLPPLAPQLAPLDLIRYRRLLEACRRRGLWGVKDPELCYYVGPFLKHVGVPVAAIATIRDPEEVAASLRAIRGFSPEECRAIARDYRERQARALAEVAEAARGAAPLVIDYVEALADPGGTVRRIADHVGRPVTDRAEAMIRPDLRRFGPAPAQGVSTLTM